MIIIQIINGYIVTAIIILTTLICLPCSSSQSVYDHSVNLEILIMKTKHIKHKTAVSRRNTSQRNKYLLLSTFVGTLV